MAYVTQASSEPDTNTPQEADWREVRKAVYQRECRVDFDSHLPRSAYRRKGQLLPQFRVTCGVEHNRFFRAWLCSLGRKTGGFMFSWKQPGFLTGLSRECTPLYLSDCSMERDHQSLFERKLICGKHILAVK